MRKVDLTQETAHRIAVVSPVHDDWETYFQLVAEIEALEGIKEYSLHLFALDDGSDKLAGDPDEGLNLGSNVTHLEIIRLASNLGHQRAIAVGLAEILRREIYQAAAVMDADGEDRPEDLVRLIASYFQNPSRIAVAARRARSEGRLFRLFYTLYRLLFRALVGVPVNFGNFCVIPASQLSRLAYDANSWNHLAATIVRSGAELESVPTARGSRYSGKSKMRLEALIVHGLSAISVFAEAVFVRVLLAFAALEILALLGIATVVGILLFTELAIPGWATSAVGLLFVIALQAMIIGGVAAFSLLNQRARPILIPAIDALRYIHSRKILFSSDGR